MKKHTKILFGKAVDSLILSISLFNNPWDRGRKEAVLILLDRAFELLLKAIILYKGGKIREPYAKETIGHEKCVKKCTSDNQVKCLTDEQALTIQIINSLRDAAQHDIVSVSEQELYMYSQAGVTLFRGLLKQEFGKELSSYLPERVLPVSTEPPRNLHSMVDADFEEVRKMLKPKSRRQIEAKSKLKSLAIIESTIKEINSQPGEFELRKITHEIKKGKSWQDIFPGVASLQLETTGTGINVDIRLTKKEGAPVHLVPEGSTGATTLAVKRVNELDYYSLGAQKMADKIGITRPKLLALIWFLNLQESDEYFKVIKIDSTIHKRYSKKAYELIVDTLKHVNLNEVWEKYKNREK